MWDAVDEATQKDKKGLYGAGGSHHYEEGFFTALPLNIDI